MMAYWLVPLCMYVMYIQVLQEARRRADRALSQRDRLMTPGEEHQRYVYMYKLMNEKEDGGSVCL